MTTKDDYQCTNVETPNCFMEEKIINDVTSQILSNLTVRGINRRRMMGMVLREWYAKGNQHRTATIFLGRFKSRFARPMSTGTAKNFPTSSPSLSKNRTVILSLKRSAS